MQPISESSSAQVPSPQKTVIKYRITWTMNTGYTGHGQPVFTLEEATESVKYYNDTSNGETYYKVEAVEVEED